MVSKTSLVEFAKHPFTYRERSRMERAKARLETQRASPVLQFGSVTIVNPVYTGSNPYRGPEVYDPKTMGEFSSQCGHRDPRAPERLGGEGLTRA